MEAGEIARGLSERGKRCISYYAMADVSPRDPVKIKHESNIGWSTGTIEWALRNGFIEVGPKGWHVLTDLGRAVAALLEK